MKVWLITILSECRFLRVQYNYQCSDETLQHVSVPETRRAHVCVSVYKSTPGPIGYAWAWMTIWDEMCRGISFTFILHASPNATLPSEPRSISQASFSTPLGAQHTTHYSWHLSVTALFSAWSRSLAQTQVHHHEWCDHYGGWPILVRSFTAKTS